MTAVQLGEWAIAFGKRILTEAIHWFEQILVATGLRGVWAGVMVFVAVFSILLIPLRGGADLTGGALGSFVKSRVNHSKPKSRVNHSKPTDHQD